MTLVVVASRREIPPFGLEGGEDGASGRQWVEHPDGAITTMSGRSRAELAPGDRLRHRNPRRRRVWPMTEQVIQALVSGLLMGLIYALVAAGLSLIFGLMDVVNFAHGEMLMLAMYAAVLVFGYTGLDPLLQLPIVCAGMFLLGVLVYRGIIARALSVRFNRGMVQIFATFGLAIFIRGAAQFAFGGDFRSISGSWLANRTANLAGIYVPLSRQLAASLVCLPGLRRPARHRPHRVRPRARGHPRGPRRRRPDRHRPRPHLRPRLGPGPRHRRRRRGDAHRVLLRVAHCRRQLPPSSPTSPSPSAASAPSPAPCWPASSSARSRPSPPWCSSPV